MLKVLLIFIFASTFSWAAPTGQSTLMRLLDGTSSHISGPNCWNGALYAADLVDSLRSTNPKEWLFHLNKNCIEIKSPQKGDVGRIFHPDRGEVHGFIYIDEETIFAKHGEDSMHGYEIMSMEKMLDQYGKDRSCRISGSNETHCFNHIRYYECKRNPQESETRLSGVLSSLEEFVFSSETKYHYKMNCRESQNFFNREAILKRVAEQLSLLKDKVLTEQEMAELDSIERQLSHIQQHTQIAVRCKRPRSLKYRMIKEARKALKELTQKKTL